jgi:hypothetical protein
LFFNRIKVLNKNLVRSNPSKVTQQIQNSIEENYFCAGYAYQNALDFAKARQAFVRSLAIRLTLRSLKGLILTFLPASLYRRLKQLQQKMQRFDAIKKND